MLSKRAFRLVATALIVACVLLYAGWTRPLDWYEGSILDKPPPDATPQSQTHHQGDDGHGSSPAHPVPPPVLSGEKDSSDDDFKRPTSLDDVRPPATSDTNSPEPVQQVIPAAKPTDCPAFEKYMRSRPGPPSAGSRQFPLVRPPPECRAFAAPAVDAYIEKMETRIADPDLYRLFQNSFPNTLDTMVKWHGLARDADGNETAEELSYIITGDIDAMWLRDSASQLYSYRSFLSAENTQGNDNLTSLNSLWRGLINSHSRYIRISPYCHSFQPPPESGIPPTHNGAYAHNNPQPPYDPSKVFDCKWELDSLASFLQVSVGYWTNTHDLAFFARYGWIEAVKAAVDAAAAMRLGTYDAEGRVQPSAWTFTGWTNRGTETLSNDGFGNPVRSNGMVRSAFRPSDDAAIFQLLVPANMMWAKYLEEASVMMEKLAEGAVHPIDPEKQALARELTQTMRDFAFGIRKGIDADAIVTHREFGEIFAYECDGYGGVNLMDDANVPSLLSIPLFQYTESQFTLPDGVQGRDYSKIYQNTRRFIMSASNPYWAQGPVISAVGGPHLGPGKAWPMAALVAAITAFDADSGLVDEASKSSGGTTGTETLMTFVGEQLHMVLNSTSGWGVVHESVNSWEKMLFTRAWFGWANGLLGELVVRIEGWEDRNSQVGAREGLLGRSWQ